MAKVVREKTLLTQAGDQLAEQDIDALADEAEAGYDLSHSRWIKVGRPALGRSAGESPRIGFRATKDLYDAAQSQAKAEGLTVSALAREAMERYLASGERPTRRRAGQTKPVQRRRLVRTSSNSA